MFSSCRFDVERYPWTVALAESLRSEGLLYGITTHIFFPPTMYTPGFDEENKTKPAITRKIESTDEGLTAEQAAQGLFNGVENGEFHITADLITSLFKASTRGSAPRGNALFDTVLDVIALVGTLSYLVRPCVNLVGDACHIRSECPFGVVRLITRSLRTNRNTMPT